ncbi:luciferin 4-monooxygenase-like isoform X1 [Neodiprion fabricii]|uniref:luciferin 4-monooxygenase-like isoform X1 n=1 Tax=Neodiprion fabricii TaxID=2872261 RepID=UPI001ED93F27|nr:luciferin 4-monooxygenase-like isoform X1 [Neodiprion fabricii]
MGFNQSKSNVPLSNGDVWKYVKSQSERFDASNIIQQNAASGEKLNFNEFSENVESLASVLRDIELTSGVGICSENNLEYCWILLGVLHAGVRCTLLSPTYTERELRHFLNLTKPDIVLCSRLVGDKLYENGESFDAICSAHSFVKGVYVWGPTGCKSLFASLRSVCKNNNNTTRDRKGFEGSREALVLASSGSTGLPKGVVLTHRAVVESLKLSSVYANSCETALGLMPLFHSYGLILGLMCLCEGSKFIIVPKLMGAKDLSEIVCTHQIKNLYIIPSLLAMIGKSSMFTKDNLACVRHVWTSAGKVSRRVQELAVEKLPRNAVVHHCYGMTETTFVTMTGPVGKPECSGKLVSNVECRVIRDTGEICGPDEMGELCFRGPTIMKGYLDNEEATSEALQTDGWLRSGDLGFYDRDGDFFIVDRLKEMIKYQGNQVSPVEIEGVILELSDVLEAAVAGLPSEDFGELPAAGVVVKPESKLSAEDVEEHVARQLSPYKRLRGGVFFFEELPKTGTGKIRRKVLLNLITNITRTLPALDR